MKKNIRNILYMGLFLAIMLFAACQNHLLKPPSEKFERLPDGFGRVNISFGAQGVRTIFPTQSFTSYEYTFIKDKGTAEESEAQEKAPENGMFVLEAGNWNVAVKAYNGDTLAAEGSADFILAKSESKMVNVVINPTVVSGAGIFSYNIRYMPGTTVTTFTLENLSDNSMVTLDHVIGSTGIHDTVELESGSYLLNLSFTRAGLSSGTTEVVVIYPDLTTEYGTEREPVVFGSSYFVPSEEGIYVGLVTFAGDIEDTTYQTPILLNNFGRNNLISRINSYYDAADEPGNALFYGVHKGLANLTINEAVFPSDLMSVNLITFTDGLDIGSSSRSNDAPIEGEMFNSSSEYSAYLKGEIQNRTIAGKPITAYSVGVQGSGVNAQDFQTAIENIASPDKAHKLTNFNEVQTVFEEIANGLVIEGDSKYVFNMITPEYEDGTRVRMTFNPITGTASASADASTRYIEGTITITGSGSGRTFILTNISSSGGISTGLAAAASLTGTRNGSKVTFTFENISGYKQEYQADAKLWYKTSSTASWQIESGYDSSGSTTIIRDTYSTVVYLVMDASQSLTAEQISTMRTAAVNFINRLYSRYNMTQSTNYLTSGVWANGNITTSGETHQYMFNVTAGTQYNIWLNDEYEGDNSRNLDAKISARYNNGSSIFSSIDSAWSTPRTFTAASNGTVTLSIQSYNNSRIGTYAVVYNTGSGASRPNYNTPPLENHISPDAVWPIEEDIWVNGNLKSGKTDTYSFDVEAGTRYYVWWNDYYSGNSTKTADVRVSARYSNITTDNIFTNIDSGWTTPRSFTADASGKVYVSVSGYSNSTGTYAIGYTTIPVIPETAATPLTNNEWKDGTLSSGQRNTYSFDVTEGEIYYVWWNESGTSNGDGTKTANVDVSALYSNGATVFITTASGWTTPRSFTAATSDKVYISVSGSSISPTGSYAVGYTTNIPFRPETVITPLADNEWEDGELSDNGQENVYSFAVTEGETYYIWWNRSGNGDGTKTANVRVSARYSNSTTDNIFANAESSWTTPRSFTAAASGTVYIRVIGSSISPTGTYAVGYTTSISVRPETVITPLTDNEWEDGELSDNGQENVYSFAVTEGETYYVWWNKSGAENGDGTKTANVRVDARYGNSTTDIFAGIDSGWITPSSFTATTNGNVYIRVSGYYTTATGTYAVGYTTNIPVLPETAAIPLTNNEWEDGTLTSGQQNTYSFDVEEGEKYYIWWNGSSFNGNGTKTAAVRVSARYSNSTTDIFTNAESSWTTPKSFTATMSGKVYVSVSGYSTTTTGTYAVGYTTIPVLPKTVMIPLTENEWENGTLSSGPQNAYTFDIMEGERYYVWWNETGTGNGDGTKTADVNVSAVHSNGTSFFTGAASGWTAPRSFTAAASGKVYIRVSGIFTTTTGSYAVGYTTISVLPETTAIPLTNNEWEDGMLTSRQQNTYSFDVTEGETYYLWWNEYGTGNGDGTKAANVRVSARYSNSATDIFTNVDSGWTTPRSFTATASGKVYVIVSGYSATTTGSYAVGYTTNVPVRPGTVAIPLTDNEWADGTLSSDQQNTYSFDVEAGETYYIWWNQYGTGNGDDTMTGNVRISARYGNSTTDIFTNADYGWTTPRSFTATASGKVYVIVSRYSSTTTGSYAVGYTTNIPVLPETVVIPLTNNEWEDGTVLSGQQNTYSFDIEAGEMYYVWWNESGTDNGDGTKTADVRVSACYGNSTTDIFTNINSAWTTPRSFTAAASGKVYVRVSGYYSTATTRTYAVAYNDTGTRPAVE